MPDPELDAIVVGSGPERAGGGDRARPGRPIGAGARGSADDRRRHAHRGAHAARATSTTCARRSTRCCSARPSCRRCRSPSTASRCVHPDLPLAHPLDGGGAVALHRSVEETAAGLGARRRAPTAACSARSCATGTRSLRRPARAAAAPAPAPAAGGAVRGARPALRGRPGAPPLRRRAGAGAPGGERRPLDAAARPRRARGRSRLMLVDARARASAGPWPWAARARSPTRWRRYLRSLGGEIETGTTGDARSAELPPSRAVLLDVTPRELARDRGDRLPPRYRRALAPLPLRPRRVQGRLRADGPVPWTAAACRARRHGARRRHACARSPPPRPTSPPAGTRGGRSCWSPSRACSTRAGRRPASTRCGRTATSRTAPTST